jgi:hypothetical protein
MQEVIISQPDLLNSFKQTKEDLDNKYEQILGSLKSSINDIEISANTKQTQDCVKAILDSEVLIFKLRTLLMEERFGLNKIISASDKEGAAKLLAGHAKVRLKDLTDLNTRLSELSADAEQVQRAWYSWNYKTF